MSMYKYDGSNLVKWDVRKVPLTVDTSMLEDPDHVAAIRDGHDHQDTMYTKELIKLNIGSNIDLARILRNHFEDRNQHGGGDGDGRYWSFNADENIFKRMMLVQFRVRDIERPNSNK